MENWYRTFQDTLNEDKIEEDILHGKDSYRLVGSKSDEKIFKTATTNDKSAADIIKKTWEEQGYSVKVSSTPLDEK